MENDFVHGASHPVNEGVVATLEVGIGDFGGEADISVRVQLVITDVDTSGGQVVVVRLSAFWEVAIVENGRPSDIFEISWQHSTHHDVLMSGRAAASVLVFGLDLDLIANLSVDVVLPFGLTGETDLLRNAEVSIEDSFDTDGDVASELVATWDDTVKNDRVFWVGTVVVVADLLAIFLSDDIVRKFEAFSTDAVVLEQSGTIDIF